MSQESVHLLGSSARSVFDRLVRARAWLRSGRRLALACGLLAIIVWQTSFLWKAPNKFNSQHRQQAGTGAHSEWKFFYFLYHLGLYPVATDAHIFEDSRAHAEYLFKSQPAALKQDEEVTFRSGDRGRVFLFYVDKWLGGSAINPSYRPANALAFTLALCLLFAALWSVDRTLLGVVIVVLMGSNPFQLDAIHAQSNVFCWSLTALLLVMALHVPLFEPTRRLRYEWLAPLATGVVMAAIRTVRSEPMPALGVAVLAYLTLRAVSWKRRLALVGVLCVTFTLGNLATGAYVESKFREASRRMEEIGAEPYRGPVPLHHEFWHVIFCGLGDFDTKYGYAWRDAAAYKYALPLLEARHGKKLRLNPDYAVQATSYDRRGKYRVYFSETEGYHEIIRDKVVGDIRRDPLWYADILMKRAWRILTVTTPLTLESFWGRVQVPSQGIGPVALLLFVVLFMGRRTLDWKLLVSSAASSTTPLLAYSREGTTSYTCLHIFCVAILINELLIFVHSTLRRFREQHSTSPAIETRGSH